MRCKERRKSLCLVLLNEGNSWSTQQQRSLPQQRGGVPLQTEASSARPSAEPKRYRRAGLGSLRYRPWEEAPLASARPLSGRRSARCPPAASRRAPAAAGALAPARARGLCRPGHGGSAEARRRGRGRHRGGLAALGTLPPQPGCRSGTSELASRLRICCRNFRVLWDEVLYIKARCYSKRFYYILEMAELHNIGSFMGKTTRLLSLSQIIAALK